MAKLTWFKHYNGASQGDTIQQFIANQEYDCVVLFWILLEFLSRTEDTEKRGETSVEIRFLARSINMKPVRLIKLLHRFDQIAPDWKLTVNGEKISFLVPNWLELQENRGGKKHSKKSRNPGEVRGKIVRGKIVDSETAILLFEIWNQHRGNLPKAESLTNDRKKKCNARLKTNPSVDYWIGVVQRMATSEYCNGSGKDGWFASFDFLLQPDTHVKVLEGKYDSFKEKKKPVDHFCGIAEV